MQVAPSRRLYLERAVKIGTKNVKKGLQPSLRYIFRAKKTIQDSAMKPAAPPVLRDTRLLDQVLKRVYYRHYSLRTEQAYVQWVHMLVKLYDLRHPRDMGQLKIEGFLTIVAE